MESQDSSIPSVLTIQDTNPVEVKNDGTMILNTGDIAIVYDQWKEDAGGNLDGMWRGSSVEFFPPFHRFFHLY
jgi:hypothetical protein